MGYKIIVDYGKPYEINCRSEDDLKEEMTRLEQQYKENMDSFSYFDVVVLDEVGNVFEELKL